ncbi:hypothetical protein ORV05_04860 [Amycolatopsis cynarae]|uniref:Uncharacterized protein n=1 Tax=Amycolatopsis cynarae TaxID=2995223 RepID=A0ABY7B596_9PSEU|nr:hypothetical protein [Amycolatopsis sp. HUAS 11-8]WAL67122.1 hypothetical protein ORV05_04860 [Amycolatopsis sp. HUAS 11-8]
MLSAIPETGDMPAEAAAELRAAQSRRTKAYMENGVRDRPGDPTYYVYVPEGPHGRTIVAWRAIGGEWHIPEFSRPSARVRKAQQLVREAASQRAMPEVAENETVIKFCDDKADDWGRREFFAYWIGDSRPGMNEDGIRGQLFFTDPDKFAERVRSGGETVRYLND